MASRYGEFVLLVVMLLVALVGVSVAMQSAAESTNPDPPADQYTVDVQFFANDTVNRTVVDHADLTGPQQVEFDRARNATLSTETVPTLVEYAGYPYLVRYDARHYEVVVHVYG